jgi:hypothetical protein
MSARGVRHRQIAPGLRHIERERTHQREILAAIDELRRLTDTPPSPFKRHPACGWTIKEIVLHS